MSKSPFVSVVVCSLNGANHITETLHALKRQTYPQPRYEIIVVDDGSTDDTAAIARSAGAKVLSHGANRGLGVARNTGLAAASGDIIAFTDDDCLPDLDWLTQLIAPFHDPVVMATGGRVFAVSEVTPTERYMDASGYGNPAPYGHGSVRRTIIGRLSTYITQMASPLHLSVRNGQPLQEIFTLNAAYRTALLRSIGGFDDHLRAAEDTDVAARLHLAYPKRTIVFAERARVGHRHRRRFITWVLQTFVRSQDALVQANKDGRIPPIFPFPPACFLLALAAFMAGPVAAVIALAAGPLLLYWWWQKRLGRVHMLDHIRFPYMQFALEAATLLGYATALVRNI